MFQGLGHGRDPTRAVFRRGAKGNVDAGTKRTRTRIEAEKETYLEFVLGEVGVRMEFYDNLYLRHDSVDVRPKSHFEPREKFIRYLQTRAKQYKPSRKFQRLQYKPVDQGTQSNVTGTHFGHSVADKNT